MSSGPTFEEYLLSKKIDSERFRSVEPELWSTWKSEFEQMHTNSFTFQKLNLINAVRRKYLLKASQEKTETQSPAPPATVKPGKPVIRPKRD